MGNGIKIVGAAGRARASAEGQAVFPKEPSRVPATLLQIFRTQLPKGMEQPRPMGPGRAVGSKQFVKGAHLSAVAAVEHTRAGKIERVHASASASPFRPVTGLSSAPQGFPGIIRLAQNFSSRKRECTSWPSPAVTCSAAPPQA